MKKPFLKLLALLLFTAVAMSSCSVQYRERHRYHDDPHQHDNDHHDYRGY